MMRKLILIINDGNKNEELKNSLKESYNVLEFKELNGVMDMLASLRRNGASVAVVSNKFYAATQELVAHFFGDYITVAIGEREGIRKKPAPDTVIEAMRQLGAGKEGTVYIGDSDVDVMTARNCGIPCISVLWGFRDRDFLVAHGADTFAGKASDILLL